LISRLLLASVPSAGIGSLRPAASIAFLSGLLSYPPAIAIPGAKEEAI